MVQWRALVLLVLLALLAQGRASPLPSASAPAPKDEGEEPTPIYRLPADQRIEPSLYEITLSPEYTENLLSDIQKFTGTVEITANVDTASEDGIYLNCDGLIDIKEDDVEVRFDYSSAATPPTDDDGSIESTPSTPTPPNYTGIQRLEQDILLIKLDGPIAEGAGIEITISYSRNFQDKELNGFYKSTYLDVNNETRTVLATQFEWTYARKAFPCFDEPEFKAQFKLSIGLPEFEDESPVQAIANTVGRPVGNRIDFDVSPVMPTYLLAFVVYEEESFTTIDTDTKFRTFGRIEALNAGQGELSQADGIWMLNFLEEHTKISYYGEKGPNNMGMSKMDQVAIPDFSSGAMENWGLVTYRESALLFEKGGSEAAKKRVSQVIAHELAHQWFGNWVTTKWWNTIWLNEGFADLYEHDVMKARYSDWKMGERMVIDEQMYAFDADSDASSPALTLDEGKVNTPEDIGAHFGTITYSKGGSILRQIRNVLGVTAFEAAVEQYLANKAFQSAEPDDLFQTFIENNNEDTLIEEEDQLKAILENWTKEAGYAVITVEKEGEKDIKVTQSRFLFSSNAAAQAVRYDVYLTWRTDTATGNVPNQPSQPQAWLMRNEQSKVINLEEGWSWVLLNVYQGGYYRVDYSTALWDALKTALGDHDQLSKVAALDRAALINNALSLVRDVTARNMKYNEVFHFLLFLKHDFAFEPWAALRYSLGHVVRMMGNTTVYRNFVRNVVENAYGRLKIDSSFPNNNVDITHLVNVMTVACGGNYGPCLDWAERSLKTYIDEGTDVNVNVRSIAYCYGLKNAPQLWESLWQKYVEARKDMTRRQLIASALGCAKDAAKLTKYLEQSLTDNVPTHEKYLVFSAVYTNLDGGPDAALDFLISQGVEKLTEAYGENRMQSLLNGLAGYVQTADGKQKLQKAIGCETGECTSPFKSCLDTVDSNMNWRTKNEEAITEGLRRASASATSVATGLVLLCAAVLRYFR